jgi:hypothetical protein
MPHVFPSGVGLFEAAGAAYDVVAAFLRARLADDRAVASEEMPI